MTDVTGDRFSLQVKRCLVGQRSAAYLFGGSGPTLLFVHGWAASPYFYLDALGSLANAGFSVVAPFLPGSGLSQPLHALSPTPELLSDWIDALWLETQLDRPSVVAGHSFGGGIATSYVNARPEGVRRLYLLSSVGGHVDHRGERLEARSALSWFLSLPFDLALSRVSSRIFWSMLGGGLAHLVKDPFGLWQLSRIARNYQMALELASLANTDIEVHVVGALHDRVISPASIARLARYASVEPVWINGTHSWISAQPDVLVGLLTAGC